MCGIIGYIGHRQALPVILKGLKSMEYRGYDSSGCCIVNKSGGVHAAKEVGKLEALERSLDGDGKEYAGSVGCGHQRWATHGGVTVANAHPHADCTGSIFVVHNGIIENYRSLREALEAGGHRFVSETDTEVIPHLIEEATKTETSFADAVRLCLSKLQGTYGLVILNRHEPDVLIAARNFSPLIVGVGDGEYFVASDICAVLKYTSTVIYLDDGEMGQFTRAGHVISDIGTHAPRPKPYRTVDWSVEQAQKGGFAHFMLKEIFEQPEAIENSIRGRLLVDEGKAKLGGLAEVADRLKHIERLLLVGCGTAYWAGRVGEYMIEEYAGIPTEVDIASEMRYRKRVLQPTDALLCLSQSGETADTLAAVREAKEKGILSLGVVNVVGSTIARDTDAGVYQHIGPEISVASTKAFTSHVAILAMLTTLLGRSRSMSLITGQRIVNELKKIPDAIDRLLQQASTVEAIAKKYETATHMFFLGRKYNLPVAYEGALKLKEVSYVHAEGYGAGELKHGPIAMIDSSLPSVCIAPQDSVYEKMISNMQEIKARGGPLVAIATEGDTRIRDITPDVIVIPKTLEMLTPLLSVVPLQLFAYYSAVFRGRDVDMPRNLAKSVTVE